MVRFYLYLVFALAVWLIAARAILRYIGAWPAASSEPRQPLRQLGGRRSGSEQRR